MEDKMKTRRMKVGMSALLMVACLLGVIGGSGRQAFASPPDIQRLHIDQTFPASGMNAYCGFPAGTITRHDVIDGQIIVRHTPSGSEVDLQIAHGTATFSANGRNVVGRFGGMSMDQYYTDGSGTHLQAGEELYVVLPGVGPAWGETGSFAYTFDADGDVIDQRDLNHFVAFSNPAICTAFAP
jgi:hypothetical protein